MKTLNVMLSNLGGRVVPIGYEGENLYTRVRINCIEVFSEYPDATVSMVVSPPDGEMYPAVVEKSGVMVIWDITDSVLSSNGSGECQLTFTEGDVVRKSVVFGISINRSLVASGEAPEPVQEWIDRAEQTAQEIAENAAMLAKQDIVESYGEIAPAIIETASGEIASISDGADGMLVKKLTVDVDPVQDLHGQEAPYPAGGGKNLVDFTVKDHAGVTCTKVNGKAVLTGTASGTSYPVDGVAKSLPAGTYVWTISGLKTGIVGAYTKNGSWAGTIVQGGTFTLNEEAEISFYISVTNGTQTNTTIEIQLEVGTTATAWSPYENECPISGWESANVLGTGKNLFDYTKITLDRRIDITNGNAVGVGSNDFWASDYTAIVGGQTYTLNFSYTSSANYGMAYYDLQKNYISGIRTGSATGTTPFTFTAPNNARFVRFTSYVPDTMPASEVMLELGSFVSAFDPYHGSTAEYEFPQEAGTVYGGTLTIHQDGSGELVVDHGFVDPQSNTWTLNAINDHGIANFKYYKAPLEFDYTADIITNLLPYDSSSQANATKPGYTVSGESTLYVRLYSSEASTVAEFKQWASANGLQMLLKLATPVTYQLTNQQVLSLLKGTNNVWADTGNVSLEYPADTKLYIDAKIAELQALILENISNS